jgi:drug/metabolite transporter (DMT)-like permease
VKANPGGPERGTPERATALPTPPQPGPSGAAPAAPRHPAAGLALGLLAMAMFGATLPVTRWTLGGPEAAALSPLFITFARVVAAAGVSALFLLAVRARWPQRAEWPALAVAAAGNAVLYPLSLALALQTQSAAHVAVITALLPLATAIAAALAASALAGPAAAGARGHPRFWICALLSTAAVAAFSLWRGAQAGQPFRLVTDDLLVVGGVIAASVGYLQGAKVTRTMGAERTICWVTLCTLPVSLPLALWTAPAQPVPTGAWWGLAYLALVSMWAAFFAWYRALDWGGPLRVSQLQTFQPFFSIAFAWPLLGERPDGATLAFAALVVVLVAAGLWRRVA